IQRTACSAPSTLEVTRTSSIPGSSRCHRVRPSSPKRLMKLLPVTSPSIRKKSAGSVVVVVVGAVVVVVDDVVIEELVLDVLVLVVRVGVVPSAQADTTISTNPTSIPSTFTTVVTR